MKTFLIICALLFSVNMVFPGTINAAKRKGAFFCTATDVAPEKPTAFSALFKQINFFAQYLILAVYLYCAVRLLERLTFAFFGPFIPWGDFYKVFLIFIVTLFVSIVLKIYAGGKLSKKQMYIDVRRPGIAFEKCDRSARGAVFIPARYVRKTKN